jgi:septum formation protein
MTVQLVLASASPRRADVLRQLGLDPIIKSADLDESFVEGESAAEHVERLARAKAETVARGFPGALVIGGDTIVLDGDRVHGKPVDADAAEAMLVSLARGAHEVLTGIALVGPHGVVSTVARTVVRLRDFDVADAARYVATGEPLDKAGAYGIQGRGAALVESVEGDYYSVVGFPVNAFLELLERAGWRYDFGHLTRTPGR